ncbi:MAG: TetR family transcriptional regulator, partial [Erysipelotrichaceae bacterium]|nr:TetR family transcriptional regulator [Erysipelotrichaceae bacterium]
MKRKTAKEILAESFKEIARKKHVDKITVKDITDQCGYSPATFYRQFRDKYDLIVWDYTRNIEAIMNQIETENTTWEKVFLDAAAYFDEEKEYLANLFLHTSGLDSFISAMTQISFDYLNRWLVNKKNETRLDLEEELLLRA